MSSVNHPVAADAFADKTTIDRFEVLGLRVSFTNMEAAVDAADELIRSARRGYICVTGVHGIMESQKDSELLAIHNRSFLTVPDGMPLVWLGKFHGVPQMGRVYGPDLMIQLCRRAAERGYKVFLYGGADGVAPDLRIALQRKCPGLRVVGPSLPLFARCPLKKKVLCRIRLRNAGLTSYGLALALRSKSVSWRNIFPC